jgi:hypothetical protein
VAFRTEGLKNLVEEIGNIVEQVANKYNVAVCTVGGYTAEIFMPYGSNSWNKILFHV